MDGTNDGEREPARGDGPGGHGSGGHGPGDGGGGRVTGRRARLVAAVVVAAAVGAAAVVLVGAVGGSAPATASAPPACGSDAPELTVHGTGLATGTPDVLTLTLAVDVSGPSAQTALAGDNGSTAAVIGSLAGDGVARRDIQTTGLSVQPNYDKTGALTGYGVSNSVVARLHDLSTAGQVVDAAAGAAGNAVRINSLAFSIQDPRRLQDRARQDAVRQAVSHAGTMALAAGEHLGPVCSLTDNSSLSPGTHFSANAAAGAALAPTSVPLQVGTQQASAQVTLVYALERRGAATT
ncbi:MAG: SIMPL domain-containing protein [Acidimicrobiales bacterium]